MNNMTTNVYFSSSPPQFCPSNRTVDIDAIVHIIKTADKFIDIAVMDYLAAVIYSGPHTYVLLCHCRYTPPPPPRQLIFTEFALMTVVGNLM